MEYLKQLSPSGLELEILTLSQFDFEDKKDYVMIMFQFILDSLILPEFDFLMAVLNLTVKSHIESIE